MPSVVCTILPLRLLREVLRRFRIGFHVERNFLSFFKRLVTIALNCAEMYENVIAAFIVCDEAETFRRVKPFYSSDAQCYYFLF